MRIMRCLEGGEGGWFLWVCFYFCFILFCDGRKGGRKGKGGRRG